MPPFRPRYRVKRKTLLSGCCGGDVRVADAPDAACSLFPRHGVG